MMKRNILAVVVPALLVAGAANAAEIYNKDGNKLDLYGKAVGLHYFSDSDGNDGDNTYARLGFKGETQINDQLIVDLSFAFEAQTRISVVAIVAITVREVMQANCFPVKI